MSKESFRRWCAREIGRLDRGDVQASEAVATATKKAALLGLPELVRSGQQLDAANQPGDALPFLASCIAACLEQAGDDRPLTVAEAAAEAGIGLRTMYGLCERGEIDHHRIGAGRGTIRVNKKALAALQRQGSVNAKGSRTTLEQLQTI
jgi:excisionase family DNA binding protein